MAIQIKSAPVKLSGLANDLLLASDFAAKNGITTKQKFGKLLPDGSFAVGDKMTELTIIGRYGVDETGNFAPIEDLTGNDVLDAMVPVVNGGWKTPQLIGYMKTNLLIAMAKVDDERVTMSQQLASQVKNPTVQLAYAVESLPTMLENDTPSLPSSESTEVDYRSRRLAVKEFTKEELTALANSKKIGEVSVYFGFNTTRFNKLIEALQAYQSEQQIIETEQQSELVTSANNAEF